MARILTYDLDWEFLRNYLLITHETQKEKAQAFFGKQSHRLTYKHFECRLRLNQDMPVRYKGSVLTEDHYKILGDHPEALEAFNAELFEATRYFDRQIASIFLLGRPARSFETYHGHMRIWPDKEIEGDVYHYRSDDPVEVSISIMQAIDSLLQAYPAWTLKKAESTNDTILSKYVLENAEGSEKASAFLALDVHLGAYLDQKYPKKGV